MSEPGAKGAEPIRRIWSEFVSYNTLRSSPVMTLLRDKGLQVLVGVTPPDLCQLQALCDAYRDSGIELGLWPMLSDLDGRWGSTCNASLFAEFALRVAEYSPASTIAIDLEPPIAVVQGLLSGDSRAFRGLTPSLTWASGQAVLRSLICTLASRGHRSIAALNPMLLGDPRGVSSWQWLFGTPIDDLPFDALSFMTYTSLVEGYSRGLLDRGVATSMLAQTASAACTRWGARASLSIGTVGGGALGDERPYRSLAELQEDVALARGLGVEDLALFDLSGVLQQADPEAWIDAFIRTPPWTGAHAPIARRARFLKSAIKRTGSAIGLYRYLRHRRG